METEVYNITEREEGVYGFPVGSGLSVVMEAIVFSPSQQVHLPPSVGSASGVLFDSEFAMQNNVILLLFVLLLISGSVAFPNSQTLPPLHRIIEAMLKENN